MEGILGPVLTAADPDTLGEGTLDPLGLASLADRLADHIAPEVTARMRRPRFMTAMAVGAVVNQELEDYGPGPSSPSAAIAFEWLVVGALARSELPQGATAATPGIQKARAALIARRPLSATTYLQVPSVFGFHGVYKRLAIDLRIVDENLILAENGDRLVRRWEQDQGLDGFVQLRQHTEGGNFARLVRDNVRRSIEQGKTLMPAQSYAWAWLARHLRPDAAAPAERSLLKAWIGSSEHPVRHELVEKLAAFDGEERSEREVLGGVAASAGDGLKVRIAAIEAYERVARLLLDAFDAMRHLSTARGVDPVEVSEAATAPAMAQAAVELPAAIHAAQEAIDPLEPGRLTETVEAFTEPMAADELCVALLDHHERVQQNKPPGKRSWFARADGAFVVRPVPTFRLAAPPEPRDEYVHPYRITALRSFLADLR